MNERVQFPEFELYGPPCKSTGCKGILISTVRTKDGYIFDRCSSCDKEFEKVVDVEHILKVFDAFEENELDHKLSQAIEKKSENYNSTNQHNMELRKASGEVDIESKLVAFLYTLMRDHMQPGDVESLVRDSQVAECYYTNGWLAKYAEYLAKKLK